MSQKLIKNGRVIDPASNTDTITDILIEGKKIKSVGKIEATDEMQVIDASGMIVAPGLIDIHVHLRDLSQSDKETIETGTKAALKGGVTTLFAMPNTNPTLDSVETIQTYQDKIEKEAAVNVHIIGSITKGLKSESLAQIDEYKNLGINCISDDGHDVENRPLLEEAYQKAKDHDLLLITHPEMHSIAPKGVMNEGKVSQQLGLIGQPHEKEYLAVKRGIEIALELGVRAHFTHVSTKQSVELVREAKKQSKLITVDTTPHHITLTDKRILEVGSLGKVNPPLRTEEDRLALIEGIKDGTIDLIATDHAPFRNEDKTDDISTSAFGFSQIETSLATIIETLHYQQGMDLKTVIGLMTSQPAKLMGLEEGYIAEGKSANLVIFDLNEERKVKAENLISKGKNTPYEGMELRGWPVKTIFNGVVH